MIRLGRASPTNFMQRKNFAFRSMSVDILGVELDVNFKESDKVPTGYTSLWGNDFDSQEVCSHLRWIAQKKKIGQDFMLVS